MVLDIDECKEMPSLCQNGICMNTIGSFKCECLPGYRYDHHTTACTGKA